MGPFAMSDLPGLDIGWQVQKARGAQALGRTNDHSSGSSR